MIKKENLLCAKIASKNSIKPELKCIAFYGDRTVATDSFRLIEIPVACGKKQKEPILMYADTVKIPKGQIGIEEPAGQIVHGRYPDVDVVMDRDADIEFVTISVNGALLGELLTQMSKLNKFRRVTMHIPMERLRAIKLEAECDHIPKDDKRKARGLIMPMSK